MGSVGRGGRPSSLTSRIGSYLGNTKFTHCLVPFHTNPNISSKMYSGDGSEIVGISVRGKFLAYSSSGIISKGNVFIDTGAPPTILPKDFYHRLEQEVKSSIPVTPYQDPQLGTQLCYRVPTSNFISPKTTDAFMLVVCFNGGRGSFLLFRPRTTIACDVGEHARCWHIW
ncbi:hypothetical protein NC651_038829 [Populus alba x Populus x berolinensis]|nr:hypothetical protein NC651_038829 [Populus alba x Populus x berolinensis]